MATQTITSTWWTADSWAGFQTATFVAVSYTHLTLPTILLV